MNFAAVTIYHKDIIFNLLLVCRAILAINCLHNTMKKKLDVNLWVRIIYYSFHGKKLKESCELEDMILQDNGISFPCVPFTLK